MAHGTHHGAMHECASHCGTHHENHHENHGDSQDHDHEGGSGPHQHACCKVPSADRAIDAISLPTGFLCVLVEISSERSLVPEEPVFALDKPPLI